MRPEQFRALVFCMAALAFACGDDNGGSTGGAMTDGGANHGPVGVASCDACNQTQLCVMTFDTLADAIECAPIPMVCNGTADCSDQACAAAMYGFCGEDFISNGCSDTFPPTVISCHR